jgi:hypothetical protein
VAAGTTAGQSRAGHGHGHANAMAYYTSKGARYARGTATRHKRKREERREKRVKRGASMQYGLLRSALTPPHPHPAHPARPPRDRDRTTV